MSTSGDDEELRVTIDTLGWVGLCWVGVLRYRRSVKGEWLMVRQSGKGEGVVKREERDGACICVGRPRLLCVCVWLRELINENVLLEARQRLQLRSMYLVLCCTSEVL